MARLVEETWQKITKEHQSQYYMEVDIINLFGTEGELNQWSYVNTQYLSSLLSTLSQLRLAGNLAKLLTRNFTLPKIQQTEKSSNKKSSFKKLLNQRLNTDVFSSNDRSLKIELYISITLSLFNFFYYILHMLIF